jgi:hypothetical protein
LSTPIVVPGTTYGDSTTTVTTGTTTVLRIQQ